jgi:hypothetical protein
MPNRKHIIFGIIWIAATAILSLLAKIFLTSTTSIAIGLGLTILGIFIDMKFHQIMNQVKIENELASLKNEVIGMKRELASASGFPLVNKYLELQEGPCPFFKQAARETYQNAVKRFEHLSRYQLHAANLDEVYHWLEILFQDVTIIKEIKAISTGEFSEWRDTNSWWSGHYLNLHNIAHARGVKLDRIFIVSKYQEKSGEDVFQTNINYHVSVKIASHNNIEPQDVHHYGNCILFYNEQSEPIYALVAHHSSDGHCENVIIYGDPQEIRPIFEAYKRIERVSNPYSPTSKNETPSSSNLFPKKLHGLSRA